MNISFYKSRPLLKNMKMKIIVVFAVILVVTVVMVLVAVATEGIFVKLLTTFVS